MDKADPFSPKLTEHDKEVLRQIIDHAKIPDKKIAKSMGISAQAVFQIRNKLEKIGIIKGYSPIIDYKKIGIQVCAAIVLRMTPKVWSIYSDDQISDKIAKIPYIFGAYRVTDLRASHILILGFRDVVQKEQYLIQLQTKFSTQVEIVDVYTFSVDKIITQNPIGLLYEIIDKKDFSPFELFPLLKRSKETDIAKMEISNDITERKANDWATKQNAPI